MQRVHCPRHEERTPSCVVYPTHAYCYGGCGPIPLSELGATVRPGRAAPPEDLGAMLGYIAGLPRARIRGLDLPADGDSYYLVWPSADYYKRRKFLPGDGSKYLCPRGHKKPLYVPRAPTHSKVLAIVEGELNALSLSSIGPNMGVCSPGGVGDFNEKLLDQIDKLFLDIDRYHIIVDRDGPGLDAAIKMKGLLVKRTPYVEVTLMERDLNELLVSGELEGEASRRGWK